MPIHVCIYLAFPINTKLSSEASIHLAFPINTRLLIHAYKIVNPSSFLAIQQILYC